MTRNEILAELANYIAKMTIHDIVTGKVAIGYQVESNDDQHDIPSGVFSFEIFPKHRCDEFVKKNPDKWKVVPVYFGDVEDFEEVDYEITD